MYAFLREGPALDGPQNSPSAVSPRESAGQSPERHGKHDHVHLTEREYNRHRLARAGAACMLADV
jgi:hypothetical protein